jgi:hypothetical protein
MEATTLENIPSALKIVFEIFEELKEQETHVK